MSSMKVVCTWCRKHLRGPENADLVSHGICEPCLADALGQLRIGTDSAEPDYAVEEYDLGGEAG